MDPLFDINDILNTAALAEAEREDSDDN